MAMNIELSSETKQEEMQVAIKVDEDVQENEVLEAKTKIVDPVELTKPALDSACESGTSTAEAHEKSSNRILKAPEEDSTRSIRSEVQTLLSLLLTVMVFIAGGAYAALLNFHEVFPHVEHVKIVNLSILELLTFPSAAVEGFLFLSAATITFISSMLVILSALCLICGKWAWGPSLATLILFVIAAMFLSFFAMLNKLVPHFITVGRGHAKVPGVIIVIFYSMYVMILIPILVVIVQRVIYGIRTCKIVKFVMQTENSEQRHDGAVEKNG
ncbi:uncharacterized protein LOC132614424 [Lycium barbarum]|uniref:uncharacterized protein LOC132614424 n=1 Tax=Lycium barbarum TaxID=112863 RepID=UPI00293E1989|nr:uncharacterized protein LOC132614424 [Lycium barbarum]